jgi:hypothetical protein
MGSNHPWKREISKVLGDTDVNCARNLWQHYESVKNVLNGHYWENSPHYNRETDPFFKKFITHLNNR